MCGAQEPLRILDEGGVPDLAELVLHNGTIYRWNRPVYAVADGVAHLKVENRVLPAAHHHRRHRQHRLLLRPGAGAGRGAAPVWTRLPFAAAARNFDTACRYGIEAALEWPRPGRAGGTAEISAVRLVRKELLPLAARGLDAWGWSRPTGTTTSASSMSAAGGGRTGRPGRPRPFTTPGARARTGTPRSPR